MFETITNITGIIANYYDAIGAVAFVTGLFWKKYKQNILLLLGADFHPYIKKTFFTPDGWW